MIPFRIDQAFPTPQNAPDFVAAYTQMQVQADPTPETIASAHEIVPWMQHLRNVAPYFTQDPILALAWGMLALNAAKRTAFAEALVKLEAASVQEG